MSTQDSIVFNDYNVPLIPSGQYTLGLNLGLSFSSVNDTFSEIFNFYAAGARFSLKPEVISNYSPLSNALCLPTTLPSITFNSSTLPWERNICAEDPPTDPPYSWFALLLFDENEMGIPGDKKAVSLDSELLATYMQQASYLGSEPGDDPNSLVNILYIPQSLAKQVLPLGTDLSLIAHLRGIVGSNNNSEGTRATIIGTRLPKLNSRSYVFLVSLESCYTSDGNGGYNFTNTTDAVTLPVLFSWQFSCSKHGTTFGTQVSNLNASPATLCMPSPVSSNPNPTVDALLQQGYVALPHQFRDGQSSVSWFHGPLGTGPRTVPLTLPAPNADSLLIYDPSTALFDTAYAAAWQLGRMLALQDQAFALALYEWKQGQTINEVQLTQAVDFAHLPVVNTISEYSDLMDSQVVFSRLNTPGDTFTNEAPGDFTIIASTSLPAEISDTFGSVVVITSELSANATQMTINSATQSLSEFTVSVCFLADGAEGLILEIPNMGVDITVSCNENMNGQPLVGVGSIGEDPYYYSPTPVSGWTQLVVINRMTSDGGFLEVYQNGVMIISTNQFSGSGANSTYYIGSDQPSGIPFSCSLANLRVFSKAVPPDFLATLMNEDFGVQSLYPFFNSLALLNNVPFNYLVNNEEMLPTESIRFFNLDTTWMNCLLDGAFSIGRYSRSQVAQDAVLFGQLGLSPIPSASGFIIRSQVVSDWQELVIKGYATLLNDSDDGSSDDTLPILSIQRLSDNVLLCLFNGQVQTLDISPASTVLGSGVTKISSDGLKCKVSARLPSGVFADAIAQKSFRNGDNRVIDMFKLLNKINSLGPISGQFNYPLTSAVMGMQVIDSVPNMRFNFTTP